MIFVRLEWQKRYDHHLAQDQALTIQLKASGAPITVLLSSTFESLECGSPLTKSRDWKTPGPGGLNESVSGMADVGTRVAVLPTEVPIFAFIALPQSATSKT